MKPIIKYSDKFLNSISLIGEINGITLFPYIILKEKYRDNPYYAKSVPRIINHETIHIKQQMELLVVIFYLLYFLEYFFRLFMKGNAYRNISFEREAYANQNDFTYLKKRGLFWWRRYIFV